MQKAQADRRRRSLEQSLNAYFSDPNHSSGRPHQTVPSGLLATLERHIETDMERHASDLAVDYMQAYYKVRHKSSYTALRPRFSWSDLAPAHLRLGPCGC